MTAEIDALLALTFALMIFGVLVLYRQSEATYLTLTALGPLSLLLLRFVDPRNEPAMYALSALGGVGFGVLFYLLGRSLLERLSMTALPAPRLVRVPDLDMPELVGAGERVRPGQHVTLELFADGVLRSGVVVEVFEGGFTLDDGRVCLVNEVKRLEIAA